MGRYAAGYSGPCKCKRSQHHNTTHSKCTLSTFELIIITTLTPIKINPNLFCRFPDFENQIKKLFDGTVTLLTHPALYILAKLLSSSKRLYKSFTDIPAIDKSFIQDSQNWTKNELGLKQRKVAIIHSATMCMHTSIT